MGLGQVLVCLVGCSLVRGFTIVVVAVTGANIDVARSGMRHGGCGEPVVTRQIDKLLMIPVKQDDRFHGVV